MSKSLVCFYILIHESFRQTASIHQIFHPSSYMLIHGSPISASLKYFISSPFLTRGSPLTVNCLPVYMTTTIYRPGSTSTDFKSIRLAPVLSHGDFHLSQGFWVPYSSFIRPFFSNLIIVLKQPLTVTEGGRRDSNRYKLSIWLIFVEHGECFFLSSPLSKFHCRRRLKVYVLPKFKQRISINLMFKGY